MNSSEFIALGSLLIALVGIITGFILQRDQKKIRELESNNKKLKVNLRKALNAIKGYQSIEKKYAEADNIDVSVYRKKIRKENPGLFNSSFLSPKKLEEMMKELESE
ncbi:MAG: hypothetical protein HWE07_05070 [Cytophagia bacterium]|nr:hypothetical protein [Cytophagia bacterium]